MNFKFTEDEQSIISRMHEFGEQEAGPLAAEIDEQERFPEENPILSGGSGLFPS